MPDPDYKFGSVLVSRFVGRINFAGKKSTAEKVFYTALDTIQKKTNEDPMAVFTRAIENARPLLEVRPRRVGGATYQVPSEVRPERGAAIGSSRNSRSTSTSAAQAAPHSAQAARCSSSCAC